ncbi:MAG: cytochrome c1 [Dokdonella sp.]
MLGKVAGVLFAGLVVCSGVSASEGGGVLASNVSLSDPASMQNGAKLFFNYCSGCYSRIGEDLGLSEQQVMANLNFSGAKYADLVHTGLDADNAKMWLGTVPPDLSLEGRSKGPDWIYTYLKSFYLDPSRPTGWNNTLFPNVSMPNALWELQGLQTAVRKPAREGNEAEIEKLELSQPGRLNAEQFDTAARDLSAFLLYAAEPAALQRTSIGVWVLLFIGIFTLLAWMLKNEYWKDVH